MHPCVILSHINMKSKRKIIIPIVVALVIIFIAFAPIVDVNVIFDRCMNKDELATVFHGTSFRSYVFSFTDESSSYLGEVSNSELFGTPLDGDALEAVLAAEPRSTGVIAVDGSISLFDLAKIKKRPFVDTIITYFPIIYNHGHYDRDILPESTTRFYETHPESRYWDP